MADPGFPVGGRAPVRGRGPRMRVLFGENVCKNERIGFHRGWCAPGTPLLDPQMLVFLLSHQIKYQKVLKV